MKGFHISIVAFTIVLATGGFVVAEGATRFVSTAGDDAANDCAAAANPCLTLTQAVSVSVDSDSIKIAAGTYTEAIVLIGGGNLSIEGSYDETFTTQSEDAPTVLQSKGTRPITALWHGPAGVLSIGHVTIKKSSTPGGGGGILLEASGSLAVGLALDRVRVLGNKSDTGGAVQLVNVSEATLDVSVKNSLFERNRALDCGGIATFSRDAPVPHIVISDTSFVKNKATDGSGGAICVRSQGSVTTDTDQIFERVTFTSNSASGEGGAVNARAEGGHLNIDIVNSVLLKNKAFQGGAIAATAFFDFSAESVIRIDSLNNTFCSNKTREDGNAVSLWGGQGVVEITMNSTNDIFAGSKRGADVALNQNDSPATHVTLARDFSIVENPVLLLGGATVSDGGNVLSTDPLLVKVGKDVHLTNASPAIDAGTCTGAPTVDFEGNPRPNGAGCDIGADEH